jgi:phage protein D
MAVTVAPIWVKLKYQNVDIMTEIEQYLLELTYKDSLDGDEPDTLSVRLRDSLRRFQGPLYPVKGAGLSFEFGANAKDVFTSGKGYRIDEITISGGSDGDIIELTATGQLPSASIHTRKSKAWSDATIESVAKNISEKHGLALIYDCKDSIKMLRLDQFNETDLALVRRLAKQYGLACSIKGGKDKPTLVITDLDMKQSKPPAFKLFRSSVENFTIKDRAGLNTKGRYTRCFNPDKKKLVEFEYERKGGTVKDGLAKGTADTLAGQGQQDRAIVREAMELHTTRVDKAPDASEHSVELSLPGNVALLSGVVIELPEEEWQKSGGVFVIRESEHRLSVGEGYTTSITLKRQP